MRVGGTGARTGLVRLAALGTALFVTTAIGATVVPGARTAAAAVSLLLFAVGTAAFLTAYLLALGRSRTEAISVAGLFFLTDGAAPRDVRRWLLAALVVQVAVALATASAKPYTSLAYGILVPVFGLGMTGLWGARHGHFAPRDQGGG